MAASVRGRRERTGCNSDPQRDNGTSENASKTHIHSQSAIPTTIGVATSVKSMLGAPLKNVNTIITIKAAAEMQPRMSATALASPKIGASKRRGESIMLASVPTDGSPRTNLVITRLILSPADHTEGFELVRSFAQPWLS